MKRITLYEFNQLPEQEQYNIVFSYGTFTDFSFEEDKSFALYAIDLFFVELEYNRKTNKITGRRSFKAGGLLENIRIRMKTKAEIRRKLSNLFQHKSQ